MVAVCVIALVISLYYIGAVVFLLRGLNRCGGPGESMGHTFSVVIAARNEEDVLDRCLDHIIDQSISLDRYQVIVVNDRSADGTAAICEGYARNFPSISIVTVTQTPPGIAPKKYAVTQGVLAAKNEIVVFTDADCTVPRTWLETIDRYFSDETGLVVGITTYARRSDMNALFWGIQALDFLSHGVVAAAAIGVGMPLNSNANNFAFRKKLFEQVGGYGTGSQKVVSGDDDLLLQRIASEKQWLVRYMTDPNGSVTTEPTRTIKGVFEQRKRWGSKTVNYSGRQVAFLSGIFLFYCGIIAAFAAGFWEPRFFWVGVAMAGIKVIGELLLLIPGTLLFKQKRLIRYIIPASIIQLPVVIAAVLLGVFGRFSWKGERFRRTVKDRLTG
jgi:cellulose synthase/poly-beta-1,6-N-acetylglucosamine synthase-like glycosyltransferase